MGKTINIFVSYSHNNKSWVNKNEEFNLIPFLENSLNYLNVEIWYDHDLKTLPGIDYEKKINTEIDNADIAILLLSGDFISSEFIRDKELPRIKERNLKGKLEIVPILVDYWTVPSKHPAAWLTKTQIIPGEPTPLINYTESRNEFSKARNEILKSIGRTIERLSQSDVFHDHDQLENKNVTAQSKIAKTTLKEIQPPKIEDKFFFYKLLKLLILEQKNHRRLNKQDNLRGFLEYDQKKTNIYDEDQYGKIVSENKPAITIEKIDENEKLLFLDDSDANVKKNTKNISYLTKPRQFKYVLLKMSYPIAKGNLFSTLSEYNTDRLIIITTLEDIRKETVMVSKGISWEQTALDLIYELTYNKYINQLLKCKHLIITVQSEGAFYLEIDKGDILKALLIFDNSALEGEWKKKNRFGGVIDGILDCFILGLCNELITTTNLSFPNFISAITTGIYGLREFQKLLYTNNGGKQSSVFKTLVDGILNPKEAYAVAFVPIPNNIQNTQSKYSFRKLKWTIQSGDYMANITPKPLFDLGYRIAIWGEDELLNTPVLRINHLVSYDRFEIESIRYIENHIENYIRKNQAIPLSIAVFGLPGTGKIFAVKQIARAYKRDVISFNLSHFSDNKLLLDAFYKINKSTKNNECPIVIWEEFDSKDYMWLKHFLLPVQTGTFIDGVEEKDVGQCIFVFTSGPSYSFETFGMSESLLPNDSKNQLDDEANINQYEKKSMKFIDNKGPEFSSYITGTLNVKGANKNQFFDSIFKQWKFDEDDIFFPVRRALLLRSVYGLGRNTKLNTDYGLLNALLRIDNYKNNSLSFIKLIEHLRQNDKKMLKRDNLPNYRELNRFVDYESFMSLIDEISEFKIVAYQAIKEVHNFWMNTGNKQGWKLSFPIPFHYLPSHIKNEYLAAALRIPEVLKTIGYGIVATKESEYYDRVDFIADLNKDSKTLYELAKAEHNLWVQHKKSKGWKYGNRNDTKKLHNCIKKYEEMSEDNRNKDIQAVKQYPEVLKTAGFVIVKRNDIY